MSRMKAASEVALVLDGSSLTVAGLVGAARDPAVFVQCDEQAMQRVARCAAHIAQAVDDYRSAVHQQHPIPGVYGVTTGFGGFKDRAIALEAFEQLQRNILLSHCAGIGDNTNADDLRNCFSAEVVRAALIIRLNTFLKGHSGIRSAMVECVQRMINHGVVPLVPTRGSLGSSGDLCPLAHLFAVLLDHGRFYIVRSADDLRAVDHHLHPASELSDVLGYDARGRNSQLPEPSYKEGLALTNGATFSAAMLALAVHDGAVAASTSDVACAMTLEAMGGRTRALDPRVHEARGMDGQRDSAANIRTLLKSSTQTNRSSEVQDVYSIRCAPQVHGATRDALAYAHMVVEREMNAATDNPLFFPDANEDAGDGEPRAYSAGNFHGQPVGMAADFATIALSELANISERRIQLLLDRNCNRNLPGNLVANPGLNSGYMLAQYAAASVVSENKTLAHPASVDSIPTSANAEDHVAMAAWAGRKLLMVLANVQAVLAVELLVSSQALEWRVGVDCDPNISRLDAQTRVWTEEEMLQQFRTATGNQTSISEALGRGTGAAYVAVRAAAQPLYEDRVLSDDMRAVRVLVEGGAIVQAVEQALGESLRPIGKLARQ